MAPEDKDLFEFGREMIRHEDSLVNHRITWYLVIQGFLFTAFISGVGLFEKFPDRLAAVYIGLGLTAIAFLAIVCCFVVGVVADQAFTQMEEVQKWWVKLPAERRQVFPPIRGEGLGRNGRIPREGLRKWLGDLCFHWTKKELDHFFGTHSLPVIVAVVWTILAVVLWVGIATVAPPAKALNTSVGAQSAVKN